MKRMKDDLGRRMKRDYEDALRLFLPRRAYFVTPHRRPRLPPFHLRSRAPLLPAELADALDQAALASARK